MIVLANLQSIPQEYYEAASIDGCGSVAAWRHITLPNMKFTLYFLLINGMIGMFQRFADVFAIGGDDRGTLGGAERGLYTVVMFIYERGFGSYDFGVATAAANLLFGMIPGPDPDFRQDHQIVCERGLNAWQEPYPSPPRVQAPDRRWPKGLGIFSGFVPHGAIVSGAAPLDDCGFL